MTLLAVAVGRRGLVDPAEPVLHADDEALLRGRGAFETLRVYDGRPFRLDDHLDAPRASAARLGLAAPDAAAAERPARRSPRRGDDAMLRLYVTPAGAAEPRAIALVSPLPADFGGLRARGMRVVSLLGPAAERAPWLLGGVKSTSYAVNMAADDGRAGAAASTTPSSSPTDGVVLEGPRDEHLVAARPARSHAGRSTSASSPGSRAARSSSAADARYEVREGRSPLAELAGADEAFTTSSVREVMPVVDLDGAPIGDGRPGEAARSCKPARARMSLRVRVLSSAPPERLLGKRRPRREADSRHAGAPANEDGGEEDPQAADGPADVHRGRRRDRSRRLDLRRARVATPPGCGSLRRASPRSR